MILTAQIDITKEASLRTVRKLERKEYVKLEFTEIEGVTTHNLDDVVEDGWQKLSNHYGIDMKALAKSKGYI